jgi:hypothetical protein
MLRGESLLAGLAVRQLSGPAVGGEEGAALAMAGLAVWGEEGAALAVCGIAEVWQHGCAKPTTTVAVGRLGCARPTSFLSALSSIAWLHGSMGKATLIFKCLVGVCHSFCIFIFLLQYIHSYNHSLITFADVYLHIFTDDGSEGGASLGSRTEIQTRDSFCIFFFLLQYIHTFIQSFTHYIC